ncbi:hypothetical protein ATM97_27635 [Nocardia sp. MH4]|uniref:hypothetical protein n=1 Tax=Nocardia sp. MH4 TaxID=1768677 RepID=UPI001C4F24B6|nr:hypothetical protein [Nocardia sp. MH4]MBW0274977.1 hypothetical protein [Nocardia sp. MH4]
MTVPVQHVLTTSKSRPRQMHILARALTDRYEVPFEATYEAARGWTMSWCNGPTEDEVRGVLSRLSAGLAAITSLRLFRSHTDLAEAVSVLMWIDADPTHLSDLSSYWSTREAFGSTRYPERAPEAWTRRAQELLGLGYFHTAGLAWLRSRTWVQALAELDG